MKKYIVLFFCAGLFSFFSSSCTKQYLDKTPQSGMPETVVFSKYENMMKYFRSVYEGTWNIKLAYPFQATLLGYKGSWDAFTELDDQGQISGSPQWIKAGNFSQGDQSTWSNSSGSGNQRSMYTVIRICNNTLKNVNLLQDATQQDKDDLIAQAHFVRAFAHLWLFKIWGRQPYITNVIGADDQWDIPRLSNHETLMRIAADLDTAYTYYQSAGRIRRDELPGNPGNLNHPDLKYPNGIAAKAIKARVLLFVASPLSNEQGITDWQNAATANWEAIQLAQTWGYSLVAAADYKKNFNGAAQTNEHLWAWPQGNLSGSALSSICAQAINGTTYTSSECPTQNAVDMFETKWGDPLNTQADRDAAIALGHYKEQDPYSNRDPRFYIDIIYNTADLSVSGLGTAKIYYTLVGGSPVYSQILDHSKTDYTKTGYLDRKQWADQSNLNPISVPYPDPIIRLAELYLNYAEAANEAYGPNTPAPGATMTAVQAINFIRTRIGQPNVLPAFTVSADVFRPRIKNERNVEFLYEGQHYFDVRRWMDAPVTCSTVNIGMDIEKLAAGYNPVTYPSGYRYTRVSLPLDRQSVWKPNMYYFPTVLSDAYKMKNFVPNPQW